MYFAFGVEWIATSSDEVLDFGNAQQAVLKSKKTTHFIGKCIPPYLDKEHFEKPHDMPSNRESNLTSPRTSGALIIPSEH
ncbi:hypothetical protein M513_05894 [Trichuris suis]|uniref:Uncharacterized protein n=1 Tax=Trichuris suis TaxID=68888 RepID=A0A085M7I8_9BILA|nr:hypothetical protein M513_05894 [Trichuris suis]